MGLTSNPPDDRSLTNEIRSSLIPEKFEVGTTEDYTRIKTKDWHIRVLHPRNTGRISLVSYRAPESIKINEDDFFFDGDVSDVNGMIESLGINDQRFPATRQILDYKSTEIPQRQEGEGEFSPTKLCLDTLSLRMQETKTAHP